MRFETFPRNVRAFSTPRTIEGGYSTGNYANFNLATHTGDELVSVLQNRALLKARFDLPSEPNWLRQTHSAICLNPLTGRDGDAQTTIDFKVICAVLTADCLPIFASNLSGTQVGVAHAGWRGILAGVIEAFVERFYGQPLVIHLGAAISAAKLEVGAEIYQQFIDKDEKLGAAFTKNATTYQLDIYAAARILLNGLGVSAITGGEECTASQEADYFSYRRDGAQSGRMAHLIWRA